MSSQNADPLQVNERLYRQIARLLDQLEDKDSEITIPQRINALIAVGRVQIMFSNLRKADIRDRDSIASGSEVRKYEQAFATAYASRRRARGGAEPAEEPATADDLDPADYGGPDDTEPSVA